MHLFSAAPICVLLTTICLNLVGSQIWLNESMPEMIKANSNLCTSLQPAFF